MRIRSFILLFLLYCNPLFAYEFSTLLNKDTKHIISGTPSFFHQEITSDEAYNAFLQHKFQPLPREPRSLGFSDTTYWIGFVLINTEEEQLYLDLKNPALERLECFAYKNNQLIASSKGGAKEGLNSKFKLQREKTPTLYLIKINSKTPLIFALQIGTDGEIKYSELPNIILFSLFIGCFASLFFYNLVLYFYTKQRAYLLYSLYALGLSLLVSASRGYFTLFFPLNFHVQDMIKLLSLQATSLLLLFFTLDFLDIKKFSPNLYKNSIIFAFISVLFYTSLLFGALGSKITILFMLFELLLCIYLGMFALRSGNRLAKIYLLAFILFFIGVAMTLMTMSGLLRYNDFTYSFVLLTSAWKMILFSLAIGYKTKQLQNEKSQSFMQSQAQNKMMFLQSRYASMGETVGNIAHQWKQPLNAIGSIQNSIKASIIFQGEISKEKLLDSVETSFKLLQHLGETIDTFYSFLSQKKSTHSDFTIAEEFESIRKITEYSFANNNIHLLLNLESNPTIQGNPNEFTHAMLNLILNAKNALDNSKPDKPIITVQVTSAENNAIIKVFDNAGGILIEPINSIFEWHTSSKDESSGVGLYMTKKIIEQRFGGTIEVENRHQGACFTIELPFAEYNEERTTAHESDERPSLEQIQRLSKKIIELEELEKTLKKWADIFEHAHWAIAMRTGINNTFETLNPAFKLLYGYTEEELKTMKPIDLFAPQSLEVLPKIQEEAFKKGYAVFEAIHKRKDGSFFPVSIELIVIKDGHDEVLYHIANIWDLTEKKAIEERLKLKKFAIDNIEEAVFLADENGNLAYVNHEACRSLGYSQDELLGMSVADVDPNWPKERWPEFWDILQKEKTSLVEVMHQRRDGSLFPVEVRANYFEYNGIGYNLGFARDITKQKATQKELLLKEFALNKINEAVYLIDENSMFHYVNEGASYALGYTKEELLTMGVVDIDPNFQLLSWQSHWESVKKAGATFLSTQHKRKDGTLFSVEIHSSHIEYNGVSYRLATSRDITERLLLEAEKENRIIKMVAENSPDIIIRYDVEGRRTYANPKARELLGVEIGKSPLEATPIINKELYVSELKKVINTGIEATFEITYINVVGGIDYSHIRMVPEFNDNGNISSVLMIGRNVTDQKRAFDALEQKEKELRALAESSPGMMGIYSMRPDGSVCMPYASPNIHELFGITPEEIKEDATPLMALNHPNDAEMIVQTIQESAQKMSLWHIEYRIIHPTKGIRWMEGNTMPQPHPDGGVVWYGYVHDITERKEMELSLEKHRSSLAEAQKLAKIGSWDFDLQTNHLSWSDEYFKILETEPDAIASFETFMDRVHPEDREFVTERFNEWQASFAPYNTEHRLLMSDGRVKYIHQLGGIRCDQNGLPSYAMGTIQDITELKEMEQEIKNANDRYIQILDNSIDVIYLIEVTLQGHFIYVDVNAAYEEVTGIPRDVVIGLDVEDIEDETFRTILIDKFTTCLNAGEKTDYTADYPFPAGLRTFHSVLLPIRDESGRIVRIVGSARDITEQKEMEEALKISEQKFRTLIENATDNIIRYDKKARITYMNPQLERVLGVSYAIVLGKTPTEARDDDIYEQFELELKKVIATGENAQVYLTLPDMGHGEQYHYIQIVAERDIEDTIIGAIAFGRDVTELTHKTIELQKTLEFNEGIINAIPDLMFEVDKEGVYVGVWAQDKELLVVQREILLGKNYKDVLPADVADIARKSMQEVDEKGYSLGNTYSLEVPSGKKWFELSVSKKKTSGNYIVLSRDITQRKELETLLEQERKFLTDAQRVANTGSWYLDIPKDVLLWSDETYRIFEFDKENIDNLHKAFYESVHPDDKEMVNVPYLKSLKAGTPYEVEHRIVMSDGRVKQLIERCEHVYDSDGTPLYSIGTVQDITERKQAEDAIRALNETLEIRIQERTAELQEREEKFYTLFRLSPAAVSITSLERNMYLEVNESFLYHTKYSREEVEGHSSAELGVFANINERTEFFEKVIKEGFIRGFEYTFKAKDGSIGYAAVYASVITLKGERCLLSHSYDITGRKQAEAKLVELNATLEQRVEERTEELQKALAKEN